MQAQYELQLGNSYCHSQWLLLSLAGDVHQIHWSYQGIHHCTAQRFGHSLEKKRKRKKTHHLFYYKEQHAHYSQYNEGIKNKIHHTVSATHNITVV